MSSDETYLESFIEDISTLPNEVKRNLEHLRVMDGECSSLLARLREAEFAFARRAEEIVHNLKIRPDGVPLRCKAKVRTTTTDDGAGEVKWYTKLSEEEWARTKAEEEGRKEKAGAEGDGKKKSAGEVDDVDGEDRKPPAASASAAGHRRSPGRKRRRRLSGDSAGDDAEADSSGGAGKKRRKAAVAAAAARQSPRRVGRGRWRRRRPSTSSEEEEEEEDEADSDYRDEESEDEDDDEETVASLRRKAKKKKEKARRSGRKGGAGKGGGASVAAARETGGGEKAAKGGQEEEEEKNEEDEEKNEEDEEKLEEFVLPPEVLDGYVPLTEQFRSAVWDSAAMERIARLRRDVQQRAEEKVAVAEQTYAVVDETVKRLDRDLEKFEELLKGSGAFEATTGGAKPNDLAAIQIAPNTQDWILAKVVSQDPETGMYKLADEDVESNKIYNLPESQVVVLGGVDRLSKGDAIFAVYPDTTSFYQASVAQPPRKVSGGESFVMVNFKDDADEHGITHDKAVLMKHVMRVPYGVLA